MTHEGTRRNGKLSFTNIAGIVCEFSYIPFGFVLNIDNPNQITQLCDITNFKFYGKRNKEDKLKLSLNHFPTHLPLPLDYRTKDNIINNK